MSNGPSHHPRPRNAASFADSLTEKYYASGKKQRRLSHLRERRSSWLRKKFKDDGRAQALADKLDACRPNRRCKSLACPECAYAAQRLFAKAVRRYLKDKTNVVCVTIVPSNGLTIPGNLS